MNLTLPLPARTLPPVAPAPSVDPIDDDGVALRAVARHGGALCTVTRIDGTWSRRLGAQLAVLPDGTMRGSLADGCLERALANEAAAGGPARVLRYGEGSPFLDIRLPCGSGIDVVVDPAPNPRALAAAVAALDARQPATLAIAPERRPAFHRHYLPRARLIVIGSGPETTALARIASAQGLEVVRAAPHGEDGDVALSLGAAPAIAVDAWTAIAVLFHDHEWERAILPWACASPAFLVGAQGGRRTREGRAEWLDADAFARLRSPIGLFAGARSPSVLALSVLAEVVSAYEALA